MNGRRLRGGHAVMLVVDREVAAAKFDEVAREYNIALLKEHPRLESDWNYGDGKTLHLTLQFVGRDLAHEQAGWMLRCAFQLAPVELAFTGQLEILETKKGAYLVAKVEKSTMLKEARDRLRAALGRDPKLTIRDQFPFNPHVTLAEFQPGSPCRLKSGELPSVPPFTCTATQAEVKYGERRMVVDL